MRSVQVLQEVTHSMNAQQLLCLWIVFCSLLAPVWNQARGQCGPATRYTTGSSAWWEMKTAEPRWRYLIMDGKTIAAWDADNDLYYPRTESGQWCPGTKANWRAVPGQVQPVAATVSSAPVRESQKPTEAPKKAPAPAPVVQAPKEETRLQPAPVQNFGIITGEVGKHGERYVLNGRESNKAEAERALSASAGADLPDDSDKLRLTIIGPDAERSKAIADLALSPALAGYRDRLNVQAYPPGHWAVNGFKGDGKPSIYLQRPNGKVLHCQHDYDGGAEALAKALRKVDPSYDPTNDPDLRKSSPLSDGGLPTMSQMGLAGGILAAILFLLRVDWKALREKFKPKPVNRLAAHHSTPPQGGSGTAPPRTCSGTPTFGKLLVQHVQSEKQREADLKAALEVQQRDRTEVQAAFRELAGFPPAAAPEKPNG